MSVPVGVNNLTVVHQSSHAGVCISFPDVCKTPSWPAPVPIPYPIAGYGQQNAAGSKTTSAASNPALTKNSYFSQSSGDEAAVRLMKPMVVMELRGQLHMLHAQIANLPSGNPTRWHKLLDNYVLYTAALYRTLSE